MVNADEGVLARAKAYFGCVLDGMYAMLLVDAAKEVGRVVLGSDLLLVDNIDACLIECNGVGRGEDSVVFELDRFWVVNTVAVDRHVIHHADVDDALLLLEVVDDGLCSGCHAFEESVLITDVGWCP